jgi:gliding motility-associated-like protein
MQTVGEIPAATERIAVNICDGSIPDQAQAGENIQIQDQSSIQLKAITPAKGEGRWKLMSGAGKLANPFDPNTLVTDLGVGKNVFEWSVYLCDQKTNSLVTIERIVIPPPPLAINPSPYCQNDFINPVTATGENIKWYADIQLSQLLATGKSYQPQITKTDTFYVTQELNGYRSSAQMVILQIKSRPAAPQVPAVLYYCKSDKSINITAEGENIEWYTDEHLSNKIGNGSAFIITLSQDTTLYAIQRLNDCLSQISAVALKAGLFAPKHVYIPNVITPNGDDKNEAFEAPDIDSNSCLGQFQVVQIYNRYGKKIFESRNQNFSWNGAGTSPGVYYYVLTYTSYTYSGSISVLF